MEPLKSQLKIINDVRQKNAGHLIPFWHWFAPALDDLPQAYLNMINLSTRLWELALRKRWSPPEFESQIMAKGGTSRLIAECREFSQDSRLWKRRGSPPGSLHHPARALMEADMRERERSQRTPSAEATKPSDQAEPHEEATYAAEATSVLAVEAAIDTPREAMTEPLNPSSDAELVTDASTVDDCANADAISEPQPQPSANIGQSFCTAFIHEVANQGHNFMKIILLAWISVL